MMARSKTACRPMPDEADIAGPRYRVCLSAAVCLAGLLMPATGRAEMSGGWSRLIAMEVSASALSRDELLAESARGVPAGPLSRVQTPAPIVRLWDEVGAPRALPNQGTLSITTTGGRAGQ
jgi:hypothetical protein